MAAHVPRVAKGAFLARVAQLQPALGRTELTLMWRAVDPGDAGSLELHELHALLAARFGKDKTAGKGANVIDRVIAKVRALVLSLPPRSLTVIHCVQILERAGVNGGLKALQRTIAIMDTNGDKRLSKEELKNGLADYGIELNSREVDDVFTYFDRDRRCA
jgi:hypothetical protein